MRVKRFLAALLAAALMGALAVPAGAANSSFSDVPDGATSINADVLRLMGVVDGVGANQFNPNATLTRAEFCAMVVKFMQHGDQVAIHATRTIFSDVTARHWGLGYVNLAASLTVKDGEKTVPLISGIGDGRFEPDTKITLAQATTILIRVLGYSSQQAGAVWPQSYMNLAKTIGLTDDVSGGINDNVTRAQAAQLFVNALSCKMGDNKIYYDSLGTAKDKVVLLAVNVDSEDGKAEGAVRTSSGTYLPKVEQVKPTALQGRRGTLVLNDKQEIVTFVPDDSEATTVVLSGDAQPSYIKGSGSTQFTVSSDTLVYTADKAEGSTYISAYTTLRSGSQVTMFSERGKVVAIYAGGSMATSQEGAVVATGSVGIADFHKLTGGATNFTIQKSRQSIDMYDIEAYDVVTYDSLSNMLIVSDLRLVCTYEDAYPNAKAPQTITVLGHAFPVLDSAWATIKDFKLGDSVALLLTADGKVAGMAKPGGSLRSTALGTASSGGAEVFLPNGGTLTLKGELSSGDKLGDQLVTISSSSKGKISAGKMPAITASGEFNVAGMKLGGYKVAAGVKVYEQVGSIGVMVPINLASLEGTIPANKIASYHLNSSNMVDYIVLNAATGDAYTYGRLFQEYVTQRQEVGKDENDKPIYEEVTTRKLTLTNSAGSRTLDNNLQSKDDIFGGVAIGADNKVKAIIELKTVGTVSPSDFFESQGKSYVTISGKTYQVAADVECYKADTKEWFKEKTGQERLDSCKAFSSQLKVHVDPVGGKIRVIEAS